MCTVLQLILPPPQHSLKGNTIKYMGSNDVFRAPDFGQKCFHLRPIKMFRQAKKKYKLQEKLKDGNNLFVCLCFLFS